jgi:hypothetical protein
MGELMNSPPLQHVATDICTYSIHFRFHFVSLHLSSHLARTNDNMPYHIQDFWHLSPVLLPFPTYSWCYVAFPCLVSQFIS